MTLRRWILVGLISLRATSLTGQSVLERSPNLQGVWGLQTWDAVFVFAHRFELVSGGDEVASIPTFTLGLGLPLRFTLGADFTTYSEAIAGHVFGNERQVWLKRPVAIGPVRSSGMLGYNFAAASVDGAVGLMVPLSRISFFAEGRAFSDMFARGEAGVAGALGGAVRLTEYLAVTGDYGRVLTEDSIPAAWSAALAIEIPSSPHTFSLQVTNTGATTLQGASRRKTLGASDVRYGFAFTVPIGGDRWKRIFSTVAPAPPPPEAGVTRAEIRSYAFGPGEIRVRVGGTVEWVNYDAVDHTVTGSNGQWGSPSMARGEVYRMRFDQPGTFDYYCRPHPSMTGRVVVTP